MNIISSKNVTLVKSIPFDEIQNKAVLIQHDNVPTDTYMEQIGELKYLAAFICFALNRPIILTSFLFHVAFESLSYLR